MMALRNWNGACISAAQYPIPTMPSEPPFRTHPHISPSRQQRIVVRFPFFHVVKLKPSSKMKTVIANLCIVMGTAKTNISVITLIVQCIGLS